MERSLVPINPPKTQAYPSYPCRRLHPLLLLLLVANSLLLTAVSSYAVNPRPHPQIQYSKYCGHIVQESPTDPTSSHQSTGPIFRSLRLTSASFSGGGGKIFDRGGINSPKSATFSTQLVTKTVTNSVFSVSGRLTLGIVRPHNADSSRFRKLRFMVHGPKIPVRSTFSSFRLSGYFSKVDGKLCMVGAGFAYSNSGRFENSHVVFKLNYLTHSNSSIFDSLVNGVLESVDNEDSAIYFKPILILGVSEFNANSNEFASVDKENTTRNGIVDGDDKKSLSIFRGVSSELAWQNLKFDLQSSSECDGGNISCKSSNGPVGFASNFMFLRGISSLPNQKMHILLGFWNTTFVGARFPFDPRNSLIAEVGWDENKLELSGVACRILNTTESLANAYVGDCLIRLSLGFPRIISMRNRAMIVGKIWSNKSENDQAYFGKIEFAFQKSLLGAIDYEYEYTMIDLAKKSCKNTNKVKKHKGKTYPYEYSLDMRFHMWLKNSKGQEAQGSFSPFFVGGRFVDKMHPNQHVPPVVQLNNTKSNFVNISYKISFSPLSRFTFGGDRISSYDSIEILAEGIYDKDNGVLCMIGCRPLGSSHVKLTKNNSLDCEIAVNVQFQSLDAKGGENVKGTIVSMRLHSDPLAFGRLELSSNSMYESQSHQSIWRMDFEIMMVLISKTLACVFVGLQLFYVKKHPNVLPFISILTLILLTLWYMIPLLLNFDALFKANRNRQNIFFEGSGWLEANEIIVRVVTMIAFVLQFRLLQITWSARQGDGSQKELWTSEKKVLFVSLPFYIIGGLIAWLSYRSKTSSSQSRLHFRHFLPRYRVSRHSFWDSLKSYGGLVVDGFLFPQIMFNLFSNSTEKAFSLYFYLGTTFVRVFPHAYDLYRAHSSSSWYLDFSYIYANHKKDFYSTAWNIIIPCGGLALAALVYLQQRFGGRCFLPKRFRENSVYEKVPAVTGEELQGEPVQKNFYGL